MYVLVSMRQLLACPINQVSNVSTSVLEFLALCSEIGRTQTLYFRQSRMQRRCASGLVPGGRGSLLQTPALRAAPNKLRVISRTKLLRRPAAPLAASNSLGSRMVSQHVRCGSNGHQICSPHCCTLLALAPGPFVLAYEEHDWMHRKIDLSQAPRYSQTERHKQRKSLSKRLIPSLKTSSRHASGFASGAPGSRSFCKVLIIPESTYVLTESLTEMCYVKGPLKASCRRTAKQTSKAA